MKLKTTIDYLILGAGPAGLLAHAYLKLEMGVPDTHILQLEYNSEETVVRGLRNAAAFYVHKYLHPSITSQPINVAWMIDDWNPDLDMEAHYSKKVYDEEIEGVSIAEKMVKGYKLNVPSLIKTARDVEYDTPAMKIHIDAKSGYKRVETPEGVINAKYIINTLPLPVLLDLIQTDVGDGGDIIQDMNPAFFDKCFKSKPIYVKVEDNKYLPLGKNNMVIVYNYRWEDPYYRTTFSQGMMTREFMSQPSFGKQLQAIRPGKILPVDAKLLNREKLLMTMGEYGFYAMGRYANWERRYKLDDAWLRMSMLKGTFNG
jgi:hypothetical protein